MDIGLKLCVVFLLMVFADHAVRVEGGIIAWYNLPGGGQLGPGTTDEIDWLTYSEAVSACMAVGAEIYPYNPADHITVVAQLEEYTTYRVHMADTSGGDCDLLSHWECTVYIDDSQTCDLPYPYICYLPPDHAAPGIPGWYIMPGGGQFRPSPTAGEFRSMDGWQTYSEAVSACMAVGAEIYHYSPADDTTLVAQLEKWDYYWVHTADTSGGQCGVVNRVSCMITTYSFSCTQTAPYICYLPPEICPGNMTYQPSMKSCYSVSPDAMTADEGSVYCSEIHPAAHLVDIQSSDEDSLVVELINATHPTANGFHTSGRNTATNPEVKTRQDLTDFKWINSGETLRYNNFYGAQPYLGSESDLCIITRKTWSWQWDDASCSGSFHAICEMSVG